MEPDVLDHQVARIRDMQRTPAITRTEVHSGNVANRQAVVTEIVVRCPNRRHAVLDLNAIDHDVPVDHARSAVILHVNSVKARLGVHVAHRNVLAAIRDLDWAPKLRAVAADVLYDQVAHVQPLVAAPADRHNVPDRVAGGKVANDAVLNVTVLLNRSDHHAVLGAVVGLAVLDEEPAAAHDDQRSPVGLLDRIAIPFQNEIADRHPFGHDLEDRRLRQSSFKAHIEADESERLVDADRCVDFDRAVPIRYQHGIRGGSIYRALQLGSIHANNRRLRRDCFGDRKCREKASNDSRSKRWHGKNSSTR